MARAIIRFSLDGDYGSADTNRIRKELEAHSIYNIGTSVYEGFAGLDDISSALRGVLDVLEHPNRNSELDHLWVYIDSSHPR